MAEHRCPEPGCGMVAKSGGGLAAHRRAKHTAAATNVVALEVTIGELRRLGRIEAVDTAQVHILRSLAKAVDGEPGNASLWRQYREALSDALKVDDADDDRLAKALEALGNA